MPRASKEAYFGATALALVGATRPVYRPEPLVLPTERILTPAMPPLEPAVEVEEEDDHGIGGGGMTASPRRVAITFLRSMVGPFLLYLPKAFTFGGYAYGTSLLMLMAAVSTYNMMLLIDCRVASGAQGFGSIGRAALGKWGERAVDFSLFTSQFAYCTTFFIFVADNLSMVLNTLFGLKVSKVAVMLAQLALYVPLTWIRKMKTLSKTMVFANACVSVGLVTVFVVALQRIISQGGVAANVRPINPAGLLLFTGSVAICFEGIGLVLPIREMMAEPAKFKPLLKACMIAVTGVFCTFGLMSYLAWGDGIDRFVVEAVAHDFPIPGSIAQIGYCMAVMMTYPLMIFPAISVANRYLTNAGVLRKTKAERESVVDEVLQNVMRTVLVLLSFSCAALCGKTFDNFVGVVGALCACPLALIYPIIFHYKLIGITDLKQKITHGVLLGGGILGLILCAYVSITTWE